MESSSIKSTVYVKGLIDEIIKFCVAYQFRAWCTSVGEVTPLCDSALIGRLGTKVLNSVYYSRPNKKLRLTHGLFCFLRVESFGLYIDALSRKAAIELRQNTFELSSFKGDFDQI